MNKPVELLYHSERDCIFYKSAIALPTQQFIPSIAPCGAMAINLLKLIF
ncbi:MAG: hypothetical protein KME32_35985 [Mojavia pulchra JT2-VF2]|uniref:Uncharacterized protein n=1 Tax=Mojavia pulchra JT2-VF2 TaxID=287848 RepID=A0A951Q865_9NOST|nr:hypothetical protein [Mojavia pulchra JT2-VF2]